MDTKELVQLTQSSLTKAMMVRSAPSGGLPIAFRSILLELGNKTIMTGNPYTTHEATAIVGGVTATYYKAGDGSLGGDIASMSDEPFPLITPYRKRDKYANEGEKVPSFKSKKTGNPPELRYMMIQFSDLGYEYMKNMKYFPKSMNMNNNEELPIHIKSHVPAELFKTTIFRTQGKGANMYPLNPAEVFYTMYEMLEKGYEIPVEELSAFRGFDFGSPNLQIFMKPEALYSLFNIGICAFTGKISYEVDFNTNTIIFKSFPYGTKGVTFDRQMEAILKKNDYRFDTFDVDRHSVSSHTGKDLAFRMGNIVFKTRDERAVYADIEASFFKQLHTNYYHFAHEVDIKVENKIETEHSLTSRGVRETLIRCIENFKEITAIKYQQEIDELEERIKELKIYEKSTRDYIAEHIHRLQRVPGRESELKQVLDRLHVEDPEKYPLFTMEEIANYIYVRKGNNILPNLDRYGSEHYLAQIKDVYWQIDRLKNKLQPENIVNEAKETYLDLSKNPEFQRISPVYFINSAMSFDAREKIIDYVGTFQKGKVQTKIHYYGGSTILKTSGENLPEQYTPTYTLRERVEYLYQVGDRLYSAYRNLIPFLDSRTGYITGDIRLVQPVGERGIYVTNLGRLGVADKENARDGDLGYMLLPNEFFTDFIPISQVIKDKKTNLAKIVLVDDDKLRILPLQEILDDYETHGDLTRIAKYDDIRAMDISEDGDLKGMYLWNGVSGNFIDISEVDWDNLPFKLNENYFTGLIYSGNKKAYIGGLHVPTEVLSKILQAEFRRGSFIHYMEFPIEFKSYIAYISPNVDDNTKEEIESLEAMIKDRLNSLKTQGFVKGKNIRDGLLTFSFIREI